ncbi:MAG TPA: MBL fold metallo-hydrolase [Candidatus Nanopelagicaceae bacterium]|nr:MBL fold metallo-hydrolase [Candidatus Nanopelagicaceae bacterium]
MADSVFRCPLPLPDDALRAVNSYLIRSSGGFLLIDCGWDREETMERLRQALRELGGGLESVRGIFATHVHRDHLGLAGQVRDESGAWVSLGRGDQATLEAFARDPRRARAASLERLRQAAADDVASRLRQLAGGGEGWRPPLPDILLSGEEVLLQDGHRLEVIPTPGHTRGHLCLFDRDREILFAGDHVLPQITPSLGVELPDRSSPLTAFLSSLELVRQLPASLVLPAHGPVFSDLKGRVDELLEHHRVRLEECLEVVLDGARSARAVAEALPWTRRRRHFSTLDPFNQMLAVFESEAHLLVLAERGLLARQVADSVVSYAPASTDPGQSEQSAQGGDRA